MQTSAVQLTAWTLCREAWQAPPDMQILQSTPPGPPSQEDLARMQLEMAARAFGDPDEGWSGEDVDAVNDALTWGDLPLDSDRHSGRRYGA